MRFVAIAICALLAVAAVSVLQFPSWSGESKEASHVVLERSQWIERLTDASPDDVYRMFLAEAKDLPYSRAHALSHIVGEAFDAVHGTEGIAACGMEFGYGCFHGVSGSVLSREGLDALPRLRDACNRPEHGFFLGCLHGVGHGVLAYLGNDELVQALEACASVQGDGEPIGGCWGGVFMEYNFNTMQSNEGIALRSFDATHALEVCADVPEQFRHACYYEQPAWWRASMLAKHASDGSEFQAMGALCRQVADDVLHETCVRGIGNIAGPESGYSYEQIRGWCSHLDERDVGICVNEALGHFLQNDEKRGELKRICAAEDIPGSVCRTPDL